MPAPRLLSGNNLPPLQSSRPSLNPSIGYLVPIRSNEGMSGPAMDGEYTRYPTDDELRRMESQVRALGGHLQHPVLGTHTLHDFQNQLMILQQQKQLQYERELAKLVDASVNLLKNSDIE